VSDAPLTGRLRASPPLLHGGGTTSVGLAWDALAWLETNVDATMSTLETGCGLSTAVFAAGGANHVTITPATDEFERLARYCESEGISLDRVRFIPEPSHVALPALSEDGPLDLALIDGAHGFPYPALDWFYIAPRLRIGGRVLVDDAHLPSVNVLVRYLRLNESWALEANLGARTPCFRKLDDEPPGFAGVGTKFDRHSRFDYLPQPRRVAAWARHTVLDRSPLRALVHRALIRRSRSV
jgi:Methyltransferase domain